MKNALIVSMIVGLMSSVAMADQHEAAKPAEAAHADAAHVNKPVKAKKKAVKKEEHKAEAGEHKDGAAH